MYIYGKNVAKEKINSNKQIGKIYLAEKFNDQEILGLIKEKGLKYTLVPNKFLDNKIQGLHQGIVIECPDITLFDFNYIKSIKNDRPILVMLDHLEDPHNFGAIIRTCEALGIDGIIIPKDRSVGVNSTVVKTSAGAIYNMPIISVVNLLDTINKLKGLGYWIIGSDMNGENYTKIDYNMPICLIVGNEGHGISNIIKKNVDFMASIPMIGTINSLNASVSCGIILSQIVFGENNVGK